MAYSYDKVSKNTIKLLEYYDLENGIQVDEAKKKEDSSSPLQELPGKHSIRKAINKQGKLTDHTIEGFVKCYNRTFNTYINNDDFCSTLLPFEEQITIPDLYEGIYYYYERWQRTEGIYHGLMYFYIEHNEYKVKLIFRITNIEDLLSKQLEEFIKDKNKDYRDFQRIIKNFSPKMKRASYYEGKMNILHDYCLITLEDPSQLNSMQNITIFIRNYPRDARLHLYATIGYKVIRNFASDLVSIKVLLSSEYLKDDDEYVEKILYDTTPKIADEIEFNFYNYVKDKNK